ncbi:MAG: hypothetical protein ACOX88_01860 [Christensenellales bacterium]|jgi:hypothetical protein
MELPRYEDFEKHFEAKNIGYVEIVDFNLDSDDITQNFSNMISTISSALIKLYLKEYHNWLMSRL